MEANKKLIVGRIVRFPVSLNEQINNMVYRLRAGGNKEWSGNKFIVESVRNYIQLIKQKSQK